MEKKLLLNVLKYLKCFLKSFFKMLKKTLKERYIFIILQTL